MIQKLIDIVTGIGSATWSKGLLLALPIGAALWIVVLYQRIDNMQATLNKMNRSAGNMEAVLRDVNLDRDRLRAQVQQQSEAIAALRASAERIRAEADERARMILKTPSPATSTGVNSMNDWWQKNVVR